MRWITVVFILLSSITYSQVISVSGPNKVSSKTPRFAILGKNEQGIIVRRYGKTDTEIDIYNDRLDLEKTKTVHLGESAMIKSITLNASGATAFYLEDGKEMSILYGRFLNSKFESSGKPVPIDTLTDVKGSAYDRWRFTSSQNRYYYMFYSKTYEEEAVKTVSINVVSRTLDTFHNATFEIKGDNMEFFEAIVNNDGDTWVILKEIEDKKADPKPIDFEVHYFRADSNETGSYVLNSRNAVYGQPKVVIDNLNSLLIFSGFANTPDSKGNPAAGGLLFRSVDPYTGREVASGQQAFSKQFIYELTGLDTSRIENRVYTFKIRDIMQRVDGGALVITESEYSETNQDDFSTYVSPGFSNFRTVTVFYFNDIVVFSISPKGSMEWQAILRKKQISEDDNGAYSSFTTMNTGDRLRFIYPVDIYSGADAGEYQLFAQGKMARDILFNQSEKDVMLIPKLSKQITPRELLIPSYKKGSLRLVKITY